MKINYKSMKFNADTLHFIRIKDPEVRYLKHQEPRRPGGFLTFPAATFLGYIRVGRGWLYFIIASRFDSYESMYARYYSEMASYKQTASLVSLCGAGSASQNQQFTQKAIGKFDLLHCNKIDY